jgi:hypothetical protein
VGDFFPFLFTDATSAVTGATRGVRRVTAFQMRTTAVFRLVNFLIGLRSSNGATPAKLFQASISREIGQSAISFASSFSVEKVVDRSVPAGTCASTVMLLSGSMVKVAITTPSIALLQAECKRIAKAALAQRMTRKSRC